MSSNAKNALVILLVLALGGLALYLYSANTAPAPIVGETGEILSDPANAARAPYLAPKPESIKFE